MPFCPDFTTKKANFSHKLACFNRKVKCNWKGKKKSMRHEE